MKTVVDGLLLGSRRASFLRCDACAADFSVNSYDPAETYASARRSGWTTSGDPAKNDADPLTYPDLCPDCSRTRSEDDLKAKGWDDLTLLASPPVVLTDEMQADLDEDMAVFDAGRLGRGPASFRRKPD